MNSRLLPIPDSQSAWQALPVAQMGGGQPLPAWARALALPLPRTTAALLELDYLHRAGSHLPPDLRGKVRYAAARANRCRANQAVSLADLRRAGLTADDLRLLAEDGGGLPIVERMLLSWACRYSLAAPLVTDDEIVRLITRHGVRAVVSMILLLEFAALHDRLVRSLALGDEDSVPLPPMPVRFFRGGPPARGYRAERVNGNGSARINGHREFHEQPRSNGYSPTNGKSATNGHATTNGHLPVGSAPVERGGSPVNRIGSTLAAMRGGRSSAWLSAESAATWHEALDFLPVHDPGNRSLRLAWSLVCLGYHAPLARAWSVCTRAFTEESDGQDAFDETRHWIENRTLMCLH